MKLVRIMLIALIALSLPAVALAGSKCIGCHQKITPGVVEQFKAGKMGKKFDCTICHGDKHTSEKDVNLAKMPTPETCKVCHAKRVEQYSNSKHMAAWVAMNAMPMLRHQPTGVGGDGYKGCSSCHKIGLKLAEEKEYHYGNGACDSCHTRHTFSKAEAQDPRACQTCHMGFDHPQWEMWSTSKHGTIWQIEGKGSKRGPTCQTCHMPDGDHGVITSWGFLALRLPEDDQSWMADRVTILQALGVLDKAGNPTARLEVVKAGNVARLTKEAFDKERAKMLNVCVNCHGESYAAKQLAEGDKMVREADRVFAEAIRVVTALYDEGYLKKPEGWDFAPDLLQFYEAKTAAEQELYLIFLEYRMRAFQGAFHMNPDYSHWYGWAPMKEALARIKEDAARIRAEGKK